MAELTMDSPFLSHNQEQHFKRCLVDIKECITKLGEDYKDTRQPVTDDSQHLHKLCAKLEYLLQVHFKASTGLFSGKKDYWDYFWDCLSSNKSLNDGLRFVKRIAEFKTSLGRGRAFLRFSLVHHRLAETLQNCAANDKGKKNWYEPGSFWYFPKLVGELVSSLYELNDLQFDLSSQDCDLDAAWPTFARRQFNNWQPPSRTLSVSSLNSLPSTTTSTTGVGQRQDSSETQAQLKDLEQEKVVLELDYEHVETKNAQLTQELQEVRSQLTEASQQLQQVQHSHESLKHSKEKLEIQLQLKEEQWTKTEELWSQRVKDADKLKAQLEERLSQATLADSSALKELQDQLQQTESKNKILEVDHYNLQREYDAKVKVDKVKNKLVDMQEKRIEQQKLENNSLADKLNNLSDVDASTKTHLITALQKELETRTDAYEKVISKNRELTDMLHKLEDQSQKIANLAKTKLIKYSRENQDLRQKLEDYELKQGCVRKDVGEQLSSLAKQVEALVSGQNSGNERGALNDIQTTVQQLVEEIGHRKISSDLETEKRKLALQVAELTATNEQLVLSSAAASCQVIKEQVAESNEDKPDEVSSEGDVSQTGPSSDSPSNTAPGSDNPSNTIEVHDQQEQIPACLAPVQSKDDWVRTETENSNLRRQLCEVQLQLASAEQRLSQSRSEKLALEENQVELTDHSITNSSQAEQFKERARMREIELAQLTDRLKQVQLQAEEMQRRNMEIHVRFDVQRTEVEKVCDEVCQQIQKENVELVKLPGVFRDVSLRTQELEQAVSAKTLELTALQATYEQLQISLENCSQKLDQGKTEHEQELNVLRTTLQLKSDKLAEQELQCVSLKDALETCQTEANTRETEWNEIQRNLDEKSQSQVSLLQQIEQFKKEVGIKQDELDSQQLKVTELTKRLQDTEDSFQETDKKAIRLENELIEKRELLTASEEMVSKLQNDLHKKESEIEEMKQECDSLGSRLEDVQASEKLVLVKTEETQNLLTAAEAQITSLRKDIEELRLQAENSRSESLQQLSQKEQEIKQLNDVVREKDEQLSTFSRENENLKLSCEKLEKNSSNNMEEANQIMFELKSKISELECEKTNLSEVLSSTEKAKNELLNNLDEHTNTYHKSLQEKDISISENIKKNAELQDQLSASSEEVRQLNENNSVLEKEMRELKQDCVNTTQKVDELSQELHSREAQLSTCQSELTTKDQQLSEETLELEKSTAKIQELTSEVKRLSEDNEKLTLQVTSLSKDRDAAAVDSRTQNEELQKQVVELKESLERSQQEHEEELRTLQFQLSSEQLLHQKAVQSSQVSEDIYAGVQQKTLQLQEDVQAKSNMLMMKTKHVEELQTQINNLLIEHKSLQEDLNHKEEQVKIVNEELVKKSHLYEEERVRVEKLQSEFTTLTDEQNKGRQLLEEENDMLRKRVIKLIKEKDNLWKKSDQLAHEQKIKTNLVWEDGSSITNCPECDAAFSLFCRQHHCRLCGQVYCYQCCNNWIKTSHSSKDERACNSCMAKHHDAVAGNESVQMVESLGDEGSDDSGQDEPIPQLRSPKWTQPDAAPEDQNLTEDEEPADSSNPFTPDEGELSSDGQAFSPTCTEDQNITSPDSESGSTSQAETQEERQTDEVAPGTPQIQADSYTTVLPTVTSADFADHQQVVQNDSSTDLWVAAWHSLIIPVQINASASVLKWEFETSPKDINFGLSYIESPATTVDQAEVLVPLCKCNSHKKTISGELTARKEGIYLIIFDNKYSRLTSKKLTYRLKLS